MKCVLKVDKDDVFEKMDLAGLSAVEALTINHALRLLEESADSKDADKRTAYRIRSAMMNKEVERPINDATQADCPWK